MIVPPAGVNLTALESKFVQTNSKARVCLDDSAVLQICHKINAFFLPGIFKLQCALTQLLAKVIRLGHRANCLFFQLVQLEDIGDEV